MLILSQILQVDPKPSGLIRQISGNNRLICYRTIPERKNCNKRKKTTMTQNTIRLSNAMAVTLPDGWADMTSELSKGPEFTVARPNVGTGALQLSIMSYKSGVAPMPSSRDLLHFAEDFGRSRKLGPPLDKVTIDGALKLAALSFHVDADFVRVWYVSDGLSFAFATYVCSWDERH